MAEIKKINQQILTSNVESQGCLNDCPGVITRPRTSPYEGCGLVYNPSKLITDEQ